MKNRWWYDGPFDVFVFDEPRGLTHLAGRYEGIELDREAVLDHCAPLLQCGRLLEVVPLPYRKHALQLTDAERAVHASLPDGIGIVDVICVDSRPMWYAFRVLRHGSELPEYRVTVDRLTGEAEAHHEYMRFQLSFRPDLESEREVLGIDLFEGDESDQLRAVDVLLSKGELELLYRFLELRGDDLSEAVLQRVREALG